MPYGQPFYTYPTAGYTPYQAPTYGTYTQQMPATVPTQPINNFQGQQQVPQAQQPVMPTKTNVPLVTSLTEAMSKSTELNSDTFYADQDNPFIYRVSVDMQGRKTYRTFELKDVTEQTVTASAPAVTSEIDLSSYATKADLKGLEDKIMGYAMSLGLGATTKATPKPKKAETEKVEKVEKETVKTEIEEGKE